MDREIFSNLMCKGNIHHFTKDEINDFVKTSILKCDDGGKIKLIITTEELAELIQAVTKFIRGFDNRTDVAFTDVHTGITEEIADVLICIEYLKEICVISDTEINKAIDIKLDRLNKKERIFDYGIT